MKKRTTIRIISFLAAATVALGAASVIFYPPRRDRRAGGAPPRGIRLFRAVRRGRRPFRGARKITVRREPGHHRLALRGGLFPRADGERGTLIALRPAHGAGEYGVLFRQDRRLRALAPAREQRRRRCERGSARKSARARRHGRASLRQSGAAPLRCRRRSREHPRRRRDGRRAPHPWRQFSRHGAGVSGNADARVRPGRFPPPLPSASRT